jgi:hypothetical protein
MLKSHYKERECMLTIRTGSIEEIWRNYFVIGEVLHMDGLKEEY